MLRSAAAALAVVWGAIAVALAPAGAVAQPDPPAPSPALESSDELFADEFDDELESDLPDPLESMNRDIFAVNQAIERALLDPVTRFYGRIVPDPAKRAVRGVFDNLNLPVVIVNDLLQLEPRRAAEASGRFLINSTFGLAGMFDPAAEAGWKAHHADFGQTLGKAGVPPGLYLVLPLAGPSTARDAVGSLFDIALRPDTWLLPLGPRLLLGGTWGITEREEHLKSLEALEASSIDFYVSVRSAYWMYRQALVRDEDVPSVATGVGFGAWIPPEHHDWLAMTVVPPPARNR